MAGFNSKDRKLIMHAAHPFVGVSRMAPSTRRERRPIAPLSIDVFSNAKEQALSRRLIERMTLFYPEGNWLMQLHCGEELHDEFPFESHCVMVLGGKTPFAPELLVQLAHYVNRGGSLLAINAAAQTSPEWKEFARNTLGFQFGDAISESEKMNLRIAAGRHFHPVVQDVPAWEVDCRCAAVLDSRTELFLEAVNGTKKQPFAWGIDTGRSRTFCTLLGTPQDFNQSSFFRLISNALFWTMELA